MKGASFMTLGEARTLLPISEVKNSLIRTGSTALLSAGVRIEEETSLSMKALISPGSFPSGVNGMCSMTV